MHKLPEGVSRSDVTQYFDDWEKNGLPEGAPESAFKSSISGMFDVNRFLDFLVALAPYLAEPLLVNAIGHEKCRFPLAACEWRIEPGGSEVHISELGEPTSVVTAAELQSEENEPQREPVCPS